MLHGPCGRVCLQGPSRTRGKCSKHFPKPFSAETTIDEDGYPRYRRREDDRWIMKNNVQLDNRFVVPYNRYLLLRFNAHINVEFCNKSRAIKYLFKYINKPPDRAKAAVGLLESELSQTSMLIEWMKMNVDSPHARQYTYVEFPQHYVWISQAKKWRLRKRGISIARLYYCHPSSKDRFYLRMLLHVVKGCTSFDDIKTVNGIVYKSFKDACGAYGFLSDDGEWNQCLQEVANTASARQMRTLFATMLIAEKKVVLCVATSGIAALLMTGGRTAHSRFHIPIDCDSTSTCHIQLQSPLADLIRDTSLIIWDEAPMAHKHCIEALDRTLRDVLKEKCYYSSDSIQYEAANQSEIEAEFPPEFLNSLRIGNFPDHELKLKVGVPVILLRNIDQSMGLCNGTRAIVRTLGTWSIEIEIITGSNIGDRVYLPRMTLSNKQKSLNFTLLRRQYPLALSFAMTINKSQGQTLQNVGLCLKKQVFTHGQLYVALSRVTTKDGLKIISCDDADDEKSCMKNIVFQEIFN
ncbi:ATP-dependent DNA helicase PIF1 [Linum perenne]